MKAQEHLICDIHTTPIGDYVKVVRHRIVRGICKCKLQISESLETDTLQVYTLPEGDLVVHINAEELTVSIDYYAYKGTGDRLLTCILEELEPEITRYKDTTILRGTAE
jgi:hypothetical protein